MSCKWLVQSGSRKVNLGAATELDSHGRAYKFLVLRSSGEVGQSRRGQIGKAGDQRQVANRLG